MKKLLASLVIGLYLLRNQLLRLWRKLRGVKVESPDKVERFAAQVRLEGLALLPPERAADFTALQRCIRCGLCDLLCSRAREAIDLAFYQGPSLLASTHSRSLPELSYARAYLESYGSCAACTRCMEMCPTGVPIKQVVEHMERMTIRPEVKDAM
ncbi:MAG: 4Fe-4S dicluster domain-containing protein [Myxococcales bacterium]|nr:MAG: 4Fe-4S dicluster domain-containing protein [Myxococcales bacterium]